MNEKVVKKQNSTSRTIIESVLYSIWDSRMRNRNEDYALRDKKCICGMGGEMKILEKE